MAEANYWQRALRRKLSRRRLLGVSAAGGLALATAAVVGCEEEEKAPATATPTAATPTAATPGAATPAATAAPTAKHNRGYSVDEVKAMPLEQLREVFHGKYLKETWPTKEPQYGGVLKFGGGTAGKPTTWDITSPGGGLLASWAPHWNQLLDFEISDLMPNPHVHKMAFDLAKSLEQPDETTYIFKLHQGVKFHNVPPVNGRELTAEDIKYATEIFTKTPSQAGTYVDMDSIEAVDDYTVRIKMKQPAAYFVLMLTQPFHFIFPREQYEKGPEAMAKEPIGTGAFIVTWQEERVGYKAKKHPEYFKKDQWTGKQLPFLEGIEAMAFADPAAELAAFRSKQTDHFWPRNKESLLDVLKTNPDVVVQVCTPPPSYQPFIAVRNDKAPWNDPRVRRALSLAIDRDTIIKSTFQGMAGYGYGLNWDFFGQEWPWTKEQLGPWMEFNPEKAKALLSEAGFEKGVGKTVDYLTAYTAGAYYEAFLLVSEYWKQIGIDVKFDQVDRATWIDKYYNVKYEDMVATGVIGPSVEVHAYVWEATHSKSPRNYFGIRDPKIDELADKQRVEMDPEKRRQIVKEWMEYDLDQMTRIWIATPYKISVRHPNVYNVIDTIHAWMAPGWGSKGRERVWKTA